MNLALLLHNCGSWNGIDLCELPVIRKPNIFQNMITFIFYHRAVVKKIIL